MLRRWRGRRGIRTVRSLVRVRFWPPLTEWRIVHLDGPGLAHSKSVTVGDNRRCYLSLAHNQDTKIPRGSHSQIKYCSSTSPLRACFLSKSLLRPLRPCCSAWSRYGSLQYRMLALSQECEGWAVDCFVFFPKASGGQLAGAHERGAKRKWLNATCHRFPVFMRVYFSGVSKKNLFEL